MEIMVKLWNLHTRTIRVGRTRIPKGDMRPVPENLLWTQRVQRLLDKKWLSRTDPKPKPEVKPEIKKVVLKLSDEVKVTDEVVTSSKPEEKKKFGSKPSKKGKDK